MTTDPEGNDALVGELLASVLSLFADGENASIFGIPRSATEPPLNFLLRTFGGGFFLADFSQYPVRAFLIDSCGIIIRSADDYGCSQHEPSALEPDDFLGLRLRNGGVAVNLTGMIGHLSPSGHGRFDHGVMDTICADLSESFLKLLSYITSCCYFRTSWRAAVPAEIHKAVLALPNNSQAQAQVCVQSAMSYVTQTDAGALTLREAFEIHRKDALANGATGAFADLLLDLGLRMDRADLNNRRARDH